MLQRKEIKKIARARLKDAKVLLSAFRYDGAAYLCGYVIELSLKSRICKTLGWQGYPDNSKEFERYRSFKTHDLDVLLHLSGIEAEIKKKYLTEWSAVSLWNPESRYKPVGNAKKLEVKLMLTAANTLLNKL